MTRRSAMTTTTGGVAANRVHGFGRSIWQDIEEAHMEHVKTYSTEAVIRPHRAMIAGREEKR
jgi:hypothetical protein